MHIVVTSSVAYEGTNVVSVLEGPDEPSMDELDTSFTSEKGLNRYPDYWPEGTAEEYVQWLMQHGFTEVEYELCDFMKR